MRARSIFAALIGTFGTLALLGFSRAAWACSVCGCGDPLVDVGSATPTSGLLRFSLDFQYLTADAQSDEDASLTEGLTQLTLRPEVVFSPTQKLSLVLQVPLVRKDWALRGRALVESQRTQGLGDVDLGARWFLFQKSDFVHQRRQEFALSAGTSFPTGSDNAMVDGERLDDHAQLGTGGFGPYLGVLYAVHQDPWNVSASLTGRARTTNSYGYHYGTSLLWSVVGTYRPWDRAGFELGFEGRYAWQDTEDGEVQTNTGGFLLALSPGVKVNLAGRLWLHVKAQVPIATSLYGVQHVGPVFLAGVQYAL